MVSGKPTYSLNGIWENGGGFQITVSGNTGVFSKLDTTSALWKDAKNKNYVKVGDTAWRNLTSTNGITWSGQDLRVKYNTASPDVAMSTEWANFALTMSTNGQTLTDDNDSNNTWTRK